MIYYVWAKYYNERTRNHNHSERREIQVTVQSPETSRPTHWCSQEGLRGAGLLSNDFSSKYVSYVSLT